MRNNGKKDSEQVGMTGNYYDTLVKVSPEVGRSE
jgi:hypothetical protein